MKQLEKQLIKMEEADYELRQDIMNRGELFAGYHPEIRALHEKNAAFVMNYVKDNQWPDFAKLSEEAAEALFMVIIHAISMPDFMRGAWDFYSLKKDPVTKSYAAHMADRIAFFERRPQLYGTQWDISLIGETVLWEVETPDLLDSRRKENGMAEFEEIDFALIEMDLGMGLKRQIGQYDFLYQTKWVCPEDNHIIRLLHFYRDYESGFIMGPKYSAAHHLGTLALKEPTIDLVMPLQHKEAFDQFNEANGVTTVQKGMKSGSYAIKDDLGYLHFEVIFIEFTEGDDNWELAGSKLDLGLATCHTVNGWLLTPIAILKAAILKWVTLDEDTMQRLRAL
ncbi:MULTISPECIES: hypothetical protein [unclassified Fusibacter]|uniref:hypothetical protein n=1 Tax=unclassified Fusibacter TaxID=2624464 RepID=UPI001011052B|nr:MULTISPECIES: hypothetical protein [unclassified Fusibacter]MCK8060528.1 hypothetical protein [Fusibacter sp. A2]NPE20183.1 hypothetical protein [Fusibacter sp. A1]RXV63393.1 hypothetical protein DWB64_00025 [Fusibacter sp. A1]